MAFWRGARQLAAAVSLQQPLVGGSSCSSAGAGASGRAAGTRGWLHSAGLLGGAAAGAGAAVALCQAVDVGKAWRTHYRLKARPCRGATEGFEEGADASAPHARAGGIEAETALAPSETLTRGHTRAGPNVLLLFLGDSLVSGVGAQAEGAPDAPVPLPQNVAARLADRSGRSVRWAAVGIPGAGVRCLHREGLPKLREKASALAAAAAPGTVVVVVLVVGANDLRELHVTGYRLALRRLVAELRQLPLAGRHLDAVLLPALRIPDAPMLQLYPLNWLLSPICALWEREKGKAVSPFGEAEVVPFPSAPVGADIDALFSPDRMHPSPLGYEYWAEGLARQIEQQVLNGRHRMAAEKEEAGSESLLPWPAAFA